MAPLWTCSGRLRTRFTARHSAWSRSSAGKVTVRKTGTVTFIIRVATGFKGSLGAEGDGLAAVEEVEGYSEPSGMRLTMGLFGCSGGVEKWKIGIAPVNAARLPLSQEKGEIRESGILISQM